MARNFDIVVLGAGPAGAASAYFLQKEGFQVALVEKRELKKAGPNWVNGVTPTAFERVGLAHPTGKELESADTPSIIKSHDGQYRVDVPGGAMFNVHMRPFVHRLQALAKKEGVKTFDHMHMGKVDFVDGRIASINFERKVPGKDKQKLQFDAKLFVDATGLGANLRKQIPEIHEIMAEHEPSDICIAMQENCAIKDKKAAQAYLDEQGAKPGEIISFLGTSGGYSVLNVGVMHDFSEVGLLAGSIKAPEYRSGVQMLRDLKQELKWIGKKISGGAGDIPLRHPLEELTAPGFAVVGNAASQVFATHGSGIQVGLQAAKMLAEAVAGAPDPGNPDTLWKYTATFQREQGCLLAAYNIFRKLSQSLEAEEIAKMFKYKMMDPIMVWAGLVQEMPMPRLDNIFNTAATFVRDFPFATKLAGPLAKMPIVYNHYRSFPQTRDEKKLERWSKRAGKLMG